MTSEEIIKHIRNKWVLGGKDISNEKTFVTDKFKDPFDRARLSSANFMEILDYVESEYAGIKHRKEKEPSSDRKKGK